MSFGAAHNAAVNLNIQSINILGLVGTVLVKKFPHFSPCNDLVRS